jgi:RNA polymerase subunit RPABC4/transcription elongation factor Spt4
VETHTNCPYCGQIHPEGSKFCPISGTPLPRPLICTVCGKNLLSEARFCPECGTAVSQKEHDIGVVGSIKPGRSAEHKLLFLLSAVIIVLAITFIGSFIWRTIPDQVRGWVIWDYEIPLNKDRQYSEVVKPENTVIQIVKDPKPTETLTPVPTITKPSATLTSKPSATPEPTPSPTFTPLPTNTFTPTPQSTWRQGKLVFPVREKDVNALYQWDLHYQNNMEKIFTPPSGFFLTSPMWSPDEQVIAFSYYTKGMYTIEASADARPVKRYDCDTPSWSPDGSQILCKTTGGSSFVIINVANNNLANRYSQQSNARLPIWSPKGDEIAYTMTKDGITSVWRVGLAQGSVPFLLAGTGSENYAPSWSPDGQWLAFQSNRDSDLSEIWVIHRSGDELRRITYTSGRYWSCAPTWSPDGQWLAYVSNQAGGLSSDYGEIFVVSLLTGETEQITQSGGIIYNWRINWTK